MFTSKTRLHVSNLSNFHNKTCKIIAINSDVQQRVKRQKYLLLKDMSYPKIFAKSILVFFLVNINCQILRFYSNPTMPSNIVFPDIFRGLFALYRPELLVKLAYVWKKGQMSRKHGKHPQKTTKFYTAKTKKTKLKKKNKFYKKQQGVKVEPASKLSKISGNYL